VVKEVNFMNGTKAYTPSAVETMMPIDLGPTIIVEPSIEVGSSSSGFFVAPIPTTAPLFSGWVITCPRIDEGYAGLFHDDFIGIITDEEALRMVSEINLFKMKFDDDLSRRNKILFGE
jgi:hypothetical protein